MCPRPNLLRYYFAQTQQWTPARFGLWISTIPDVPTVTSWLQRWDSPALILLLEIVLLITARRKGNYSQTESVWLEKVSSTCNCVLNSFLLINTHGWTAQWREFAKEMDGVIRIGAVNCGDNTMLCRSKGINSYPSLFVFRSGMVRHTHTQAHSAPNYHQSHSQCKELLHNGKQMMDRE